MTLFFIFLILYVFCVLMKHLDKPSTKRISKSYDKPFKAVPKSNWETLPNSPQLNELRRKWREDEIMLVPFLLEIEDLFKQRVREVADWSKVDPWTDRLEPIPPHTTKKSKIDQLNLVNKEPNYNKHRFEHSHGAHCPCEQCRDIAYKSHKIANYCAKCGYKCTTDRPITMCPKCDSHPRDYPYHPHAFLPAPGNTVGQPYGGYYHDYHDGDY